MKTRRWVSKPHKGVPTATVSPTLRDLEWAAGFLEGEGSFIKHPDGQMVSACQKELEPLLRLQSLFGGGLTTRATSYDYRINVWQAYGTRARGIAMTLYSLMTERRKSQIRTMLSGFHAERMV